MAIVKGLFVVGFTVAEVLEIQAKAKKLLMEGKTVMSWSEGGTSATRQLVMPVQDILGECAYALRKLDPETYGRSRNTRLTQVPYHFPL